jgi:hypothetical protein
LVIGSGVDLVAVAVAVAVAVVAVSGVELLGSGVVAVSPGEVVRGLGLSGFGIV